MAESKDFKITPEEVERLREAMKKEEFRKLLTEYAQEIQDPENKKRYEEEIKKLESERGMDVKFVNIKPKFVLKATSLPSRKKLFINIGECDLIEVATSVANRLPNGKTGSNWSIPYTVTRPRDDLHNKKKCSVVDIGFHPETMNQVNKDYRFSDLIINTALDGVEKDLKISIDRKHVKKMKFEYKGSPYPTVIRTKKKSGSEGPQNIPGTSAAAPPNDPLKFPYPPMKEQTPSNSKPTAPSKMKHTKTGQRKETKATSNNKQSSNGKPDSGEPRYTVVHRGEFDMQDYTFSQISCAVKRPRELVVTVNLPKLDSAGTIELDIFEKKLLLVNKSPDYHLQLNLSYPVNEELANATFEKSTRNLIITLPVLPPATPNPPHPHTTALVEPIAATDDVEPDMPPNDISENDSSEPLPVNPSVRSDWSVNNTWECPPFSYRQNEECISFVLHTAVVKETTLVSHFNENSFHITFNGSETTTSELKHYSFYVVFDEASEHDLPVIQTSGCKVNVGSDNTCVVVTTNTKIKEIQKFKVGSNPSNLSEKLFLTDNNISNVTHRMNTHDPWLQSSAETTPSQSLSSQETTPSSDLQAEIVHTTDTETIITVTNKNQETLPTEPVVAMETTVNGSTHLDEEPTSSTSTVLVNETNQNSHQPQVIATAARDIKESNENEYSTADKLSNGPLLNGCGSNGTVNDGKKFVKFSNDLLYDLD